MAGKINIWYDPEGDYLEVIFEEKEGFFRETDNAHIMQKVDEKGNVIGFSVLAVSSLKDKSPISATL